MFQLFDNSHLTYLAAYTLGAVLLFLILFFTRSKKLQNFIAYFVLAIKISELGYRHFIHGEKIATLLPLHLCNITLILSIIFLLTEKESLFNLIYYWGIGFVFAVLTPEVKNKFPDPLHLSFFITHFFILMTVMYGLFIKKIRPSFSGVVYSFITINIILVIVLWINSKLGTNYLYVSHKPNFHSPIDHFGPWPYYVFVLEGLLLFFSLIFYLPFRNKGKRKYKVR